MWILICKIGGNHLGNKEHGPMRYYFSVFVSEVKSAIKLLFSIFISSSFVTVYFLSFLFKPVCLTVTLTYYLHSLSQGRSPVHWMCFSDDVYGRPGFLHDVYLWNHARRRFGRLGSSCKSFIECDCCMET